MTVDTYNKWLNSKFQNNSNDNSLTVICTSYHTSDYTVRLLSSLRKNILKIPYSIYTQVLVFEDQPENDKVSFYVDNIDLEGWKYFSISKEQSTHDSMYGRCKGIELATGKYILFLDGDDILTKDAYKCFLKSIEVMNLNPNLLVTKFGRTNVNEQNRNIINIDTLKQTELKDTDISRLSEKYVMPSKMYLKICEQNKIFPYYMWDKVWKTSFLKNTKMYLEEMPVFIQTWLEDNHIGFVNILGYVHYFGENHLARTIKESRLAKNERYKIELEHKKQFIECYKDIVSKNSHSHIKEMFKRLETSIED